jgi:hypothetical protein
MELKLETIPKGTILYHGSHNLFDQFNTYETRFTPDLKIALHYARKGELEMESIKLKETVGYVYECIVAKSIPNVIQSKKSFLMNRYPELMAFLNPFQHSKPWKDEKSGNIGSDWDDMIGRICEFENVQGIRLHKNENQLMLCRDAVRKYIRFHRIFAVDSPLFHKTDPKILTMRQIMPVEGKKFQILKEKNIPLSPTTQKRLKRIKDITLKRRVRGE